MQGASLERQVLCGRNLLSQKSMLVTANTTFMTGNIQKMAEALWNQYHKGLSAKQKRAALLLLVTWSSYVLGGVCGAALAYRMTRTPITQPPCTPPPMRTFSFQRLQAMRPRCGAPLPRCSPPVVLTRMLPVLFACTDWSLSPITLLYAVGMLSMQIEKMPKLDKPTTDKPTTDKAPVASVPVAIDETPSTPAAAAYTPSAAPVACSATNVPTPSEQSVSTNQGHHAA